MTISVLFGPLFTLKKTAKPLAFQQGITYWTVFADILLVVYIVFLVENCDIIYVTEVKHG